MTSVASLCRGIRHATAGICHVCRLAGSHSHYLSILCCQTTRHTQQTWTPHSANNTQRILHFTYDRRYTSLPEHYVNIQIFRYIVQLKLGKWHPNWSSAKISYSEKLSNPTTNKMWKRNSKGLRHCGKKNNYRGGGSGGTTIAKTICFIR